MSNNYDGIKNQSWGIEIECTGLTRSAAAKAIGKALNSEPEHYGGGYDKYYIRDSNNRKWSVVYDSSIKRVDKNGNDASRNYSVEIVSPVLQYEDIPLLQEIVRVVRKANGVTGPQYSAGIHIHINGAPYTAQSLRNLVNIFASKEDFLFDMLQVSPMRETYCKKVDREFLEKLNKNKPKTIEAIQKLWYKGNDDDVYRHYSDTRYRALNLHSFFSDGHFEIRAANSSLHAGIIRSYVVLALAISNAALTRKYCSPIQSQSDNLRYSCRVWMINLGLNGDEFKNCRTHLLSHLDGCISWRNPEDAIAQRQRLKLQREATQEQAVEPVSDFQEQAEELPHQEVTGDFEEDFDEEMGITMSF